MAHTAYMQLTLVDKMTNGIMTALVFENSQRVKSTVKVPSRSGEYFKIGERYSIQIGTLAC